MALSQTRYDCLHDLHQGLQARVQGLATVDGCVLFVHRCILAAAEDAARFHCAKEHARVFHQAVGRMRKNQGVGRALALVEQEGLRQQRDQTALAVGHDRHHIVAVVIADHGDQRGQPLGRQHHIHAARRRHQRAYGIAAHVEWRKQAFVPHVGQGVGGVAKRAAVLRHVLVEAVAIAVSILAVDDLARIAQFAKTPVKRNHGAVRGLIDLALEVDGIRVCFHDIFVGLLRQAKAGRLED